MSRFSARFTVTRTRTIIETAEVTRTIDAAGYGDAGHQAEALVVDLSSTEFSTVSETSEEGPQVLSCIERIFEADTSEDDLAGLTPALYAPSPAPSGGTYFPVQVEPTPDR